MDNACKVLSTMYPWQILSTRKKSYLFKICVFILKITLVLKEKTALSRGVRIKNRR